MIQDRITKEFKVTNIFPPPKKSLGLIGASTGQRMFYDIDGDKVKNVFDCAPNNPKRQGWIHTVGKWAAKKFRPKEQREVGTIETAEGTVRVYEKDKYAPRTTKGRLELFIERKEKEQQRLKDVRREERFKQRLITERYREQQYGRRQRERIKSHRQFTPLETMFGPKSYPATKSKSKKKKVGSVTPPRKQRPTKPFNIMDVPRIPI